jgi:hypothetical protein
MSKLDRMSGDDNAENLRARAREAIDVAFVRRRTGMVYVQDADALAVFESGEPVFDVDLHCRNLDAFVARHKPDVVIESENLPPCANPDAEKRPVYFGRARWRKRLTSNPREIA